MDVWTRCACNLFKISIATCCALETGSAAHVAKQTVPVFIRTGAFNFCNANDDHQGSQQGRKRAAVWHMAQRDKGQNTIGAIDSGEG